MVNVTPLAEENFQRTLDENNMPNAALRIWIEAASCSSAEVGMALDEGPYDEEDTVFAGGHWKVVIDPVSIGYLQDATIDWREENGSAGFCLAAGCEGCSCSGSGTCSCKSKTP